MRTDFLQVAATSKRRQGAQATTQTSLKGLGGASEQAGIRRQGPGRVGMPPLPGRRRGEEGR